MRQIYNIDQIYLFSMSIVFVELTIDTIQTYFLSFYEYPKIQDNIGLGRQLCAYRVFGIPLFYQPTKKIQGNCKNHFLFIITRLFLPNYKGV